MGQVVAISNHKGGTGKTTTAHALATVLADRGRRVLMVDADAQASLSAICGAADAPTTLADVISNKRADVRRALVELSPTLHLLPASLALADVEAQLMTRVIGREMTLARAIHPLMPGYDFAIIDTAPAYGVLSVAALVAADGLIVPMQPSVQDMRGVSAMLATLDEVRAVNAGLQLIGILPTFASETYTHHADVIDTMQRAGWPVLPVHVPRSVKVAEAAAAGESITTWARSHAAAEAYRDLANEVEKWAKARQKQG
jgi:chromosome partitioning protein